MTPSKFLVLLSGLCMLTSAFVSYPKDILFISVAYVFLFFGYALRDMNND